MRLNDKKGKRKRKQRNQLMGGEMPIETDLLWGGTRVLNQEGGELGLRDDGELWIGAADVPFPVRVLRRIGR